MYNTTPVNPAQAFKIAQIYMKSGIVPLFLGSPGCGKTRLAAMLAEAMEAELHHLRLNTLPPEEAVGLQFVDKETRRTVRFAPSWVPDPSGKDGPRVVFLDELMQAPDEYRKGIMSALLERYIGEHPLPDNLWFVAAGNTSDDGSVVVEMDSATAARFGIILVRSEFDQWSRDFAESGDIELSIMGFLRHRPDLFDGYEKSEGEEDAETEDEIIRASSRTWTKASAFLKQARVDELDEFETKIGLSGILGSRVTDAFWLVHGQLMDLPTMDEIIRMSRRDRAEASPTSIEIMWAYGQAMIWGANSLEKVLAYMEVLNDWQPREGVMFIETRTHIVETMLGHARLRHGIESRDDPRIANMLRGWAAPRPANDGGAASEMMGIAA